jgi:hypothetical protein
MGMVLKFPIERVRSAVDLAEDPAKILILPTVRIEREAELQLLAGMGERSGAPLPRSRRRRREPRN